MSPEPNGHLQVTPADQWRKPTELVELPSGHVARLIRPDISDLILEDGSIPDALAGLMKAAEDTGGNLPIEEAPGALEFAKQICVKCFTEPKIVMDGEPNYGAGEISIKDVDLADRFYVVEWAMGDMFQVKNLAGFPQEQVSDVQPVPEVQDLPAIAE